MFSGKTPPQDGGLNEGSVFGARQSGAFGDDLGVSMQSNTSTAAANNVPSQKTRLCYRRFPAAAVCAAQFGIALVRELEKVHDLEPVFYADFNDYIRQEETRQATERAEATQRARQNRRDGTTSGVFSPNDTLNRSGQQLRGIKGGASPLLGSQRADMPLTPLDSAEFTFRLLRLLRQRGVISYAVPTTSPLVDLDEAIIRACKEEVAAEFGDDDDDDGPGAASPFSGPEAGAEASEGAGQAMGLIGRGGRLGPALEDAGSQEGSPRSRSVSLLAAPPPAKDAQQRRDTHRQARQFELLQQRLLERWEGTVCAQWQAVQPLYASEDRVDSDRRPGGSAAAQQDDHRFLRAPSAALAYFGHLDVLTFCILDLFKGAAARGPGGNTGEWSPYLAFRTQADTHTQAGPIMDNGFAPIETLTWARFVMYLADCATSRAADTVANDGIRVFLPPQSHRIQPPPGTAAEAEERERHAGRKVTALRRYQETQQLRSHDTGRVLFAKLFPDRGTAILLSTAPKENGGGGEQLQFISTITMRCTRTHALTRRHGNTLAFEVIPHPHHAVVVANFDGVRILDAETLIVKAHVPEAETVTAMRWVTGLNRLVVGNRLGQVRIYADLTVADRLFVCRSMATGTGTGGKETDPKGKQEGSPEASRGKERGRASHSPNRHASGATATSHNSTSTAEAGSGAGGAFTALELAAETLPHLHTQPVRDIVPSLFNGVLLASSALDGNMVLFNTETRHARVMEGDYAVLGAVPVEALGVFFCFGVDHWPFVWSYNVTGSKPLSLAGGGSPIGTHVTIDTDGGSSKHHGARIVAVGALRNPPNATVSMDRNGGVRVWDVWRMCLLQAVDIPTEYAGAPVAHFQSGSGCVSAFSHMLLDAGRVQIVTFVRQRGLVLRYNERDDMRTTAFASFEPIIKSTYLDDGRLLMLATRKSISVWDAVTARQVFSIAVPAMFAALTQNAAPLHRFANEDTATADDDGAARGGGGGGQGKGQLPGLDIAAVEVLPRSRMALIGLRGGGIVVMSLGNGGVICHIPPVPQFSGGNGAFTDFQSLAPVSAAQEIAATAALGGDLRGIMFMPERDTLFMTGAGHTYFEHRGERHELLTSADAPVDGGCVLHHRFCDLVLVGEEGGVVTAWTQQDHRLHADHWLQAAFTPAAPGLEPFNFLFEIPHTPYFIACDAKGTVFLFQINLDPTGGRGDDGEGGLSTSNSLSAFERGPWGGGRADVGAGDTEGLPDPPGQDLWPGAATRVDVPHPRFRVPADARRLHPLAIPAKDALNNRRASPNFSSSAIHGSAGRARHSAYSRRMSGSTLRHLRRTSTRSSNSDSRRSSLAAASTHLNKESAANERGVGSPDAPPMLATTTVGDFINRTMMSGSFSLSGDSSSLSPDRTVASVANTVRAGNRLLKSSAQAPAALAKKAGPPSPAPLHLETRPDRSTSQPVSSRTQPTQRGFVFTSSNIHPNTFISLTLRRSWTHGHPIPRGPLLPVPVTCAAFDPVYRFLYLGDEQGFVTIYDLSGVVSTEAERQAWRSCPTDGDAGQEPPFTAPPPPPPAGLPGFPALPTTGGWPRGGDVPQDVVCVRRVPIHRGSVSSLSCTAAPFAMLITSGVDGMVHCCSRFLQNRCGAFTLGEETSTSPLAYVRVPVSSVLGRRLLGDLSFAAPEPEPFASNSLSGSLNGSKNPPRRRRSNSTKMAPEKATDKAADALNDLSKYPLRPPSLRDAKEPLFMLPSQTVYTMTDFLSVTTGGSGPSLHSADPGGPCQAAMAEHAVARRYTVYAREVNEKVVRSGANALTRAILRFATDAQCAQLHELAEGSSTSAQALVHLMRQLFKPAAGDSAGQGRGVEGEAGGGDGDEGTAEGQAEMAAVPPPPQHVLLTSAGVQQVLFGEEGRCGIFDDVPRPWNGLGPMDALQQLPHVAMMLDPQAHGRGQGQDSLTTTFFVTGLLGLADHAVSEGTGAGGGDSADFVPLGEVEAVVAYKEWCLDRQQLLEAHGRAVAQQTNTAEPASLGGAFRGRLAPPAGNTTTRGLAQPPAASGRLTDALQVFQQLHKASVANAANGTLPGGSGSVPTRLPPLRLAPPHEDEDRRGPLPPPEEGLLEHLTGYPPLLSQVQPSSRWHDIEPSDEDIASSDGYDSGEDSDIEGPAPGALPADFDGESELQRRRRLEDEKGRERAQAVRRLRKHHRKQLVANQSKAAMLAGVRNEGVRERLGKVFSHGGLHGTLAGLMRSEQDHRSRLSREEREQLERENGGKLSHEVVMAYCNRLAADQTLHDLLARAEPLRQRVTLNGDVSAIRPDVSEVILAGGRKGFNPELLREQRKERNAPRALPLQTRVIDASLTKNVPGRPISPYTLRRLHANSFKTVLQERAMEARRIQRETEARSAEATSQSHSSPSTVLAQARAYASNTPTTHVTSASVDPRDAGQRRPPDAHRLPGGFSVNVPVHTRRLVPSPKKSEKK